MANSYQDDMEDAKKKEACWYVLQTYSGYEKMVQLSIMTMAENSGLQDFIFDVAVPEEDEIIEKKGKKVVVQRRKFPSYVFIKMKYCKHVWYMVTQTRGVTSFCGPQGRPLPLTEEEIKRNQLEQISVEELGIQPGDQVKVLTGSFKDFVGEVVEVNQESQTLKIALKMFGKDSIGEIEFINVEKL